MVLQDVSGCPVPKDYFLVVAEENFEIFNPASFQRMILQGMHHVHVLSRGTLAPPGPSMLHRRTSQELLPLRLWTWEGFDQGSAELINSWLGNYQILARQSELVEFVL